LAGAQSRTPIDPALVHDPTQVALDRARLSEIANLIPKDVAEQLISATKRRVRLSIPKQRPTEMLAAAFWWVVFHTALFPIMAVVEWYDRRKNPEAYTGREHGPREWDFVNFIRDAFATTWIETIEDALDRSAGQPVELGFDLFPSAFLSGNVGFGAYDSWHGLVAYQCQPHLDRLAAGSLMDAFALRMGEVIRSHGGWHEITREIAIRWDGTRFTAERIASRAA